MGIVLVRLANNRANFMYCSRLRHALENCLSLIYPYYMIYDE